MSKPQKLRKGKYKVTNWPQYNRSLKGRGDLTIWFTEESLEACLAGESACKTKGGQFKYSDLAIKTVYVIRQIFNLRLRQCEGLVQSLLKLVSSVLMILKSLNLLRMQSSLVSTRQRNKSLW